MTRLHAYFDYGSPYAYLAWQRITRVHPDRYDDLELLWKPASAGHIFKQDGSAPNTTMPNQGAYLYQDVQRWADAYGVPFNPPPKDGPAAMPVNSINAMRLHFLAADQGLEQAWMAAVFHAYFEHALDISDEVVLADLCAQVGWSAGPEACSRDDVKKRLVDNTNEAYAAGAPGVPYFVLEHDGRRKVYWGNDRLAWIEATLAGNPAPA